MGDAPGVSLDLPLEATVDPRALSAKLQVCLFC